MPPVLLHGAGEVFLGFGKDNAVLTFLKGELAVLESGLEAHAIGFDFHGAVVFDLPGDV